MTAYQYAFTPNRVIDSNGIADGAFIDFFLTNTTTPTPAYTTSALTTTHPNPLTVEAGAAVPAIYLDDAITYRVRFRDSAGNPITGMDYDPYDPVSDILFRTEIGSSAGSASVGFLQSGSGAVARTMQAKGRDILGAKDHGALGDFSNNDTAGLQASIDSLGLLGGELELSAGSRFLVTEAGSTGSCLNITRPVSIVGKGGLYSAIAASNSVADDVATITVEPADVPGDFMRFENLVLSNPFNGTRGGGVGLRFNTDVSGITLARVLVEGVAVGSGAAQGFVHDNDDAVNVTGGLFCSEFRRNLWTVGMRFGDGNNGTGDSLLFTTNTTTGIGVGVDFTGTIDADGNTPSQAVFINHNSTSQEGAFRFKRANFPTVQNANMEQTVPFAGGILVDFSGSSKPNNSTGVRAPSITNSLVSAFTGANLSSLVNFGSVTGGVCFNNFFLDGGGGTAADVTITSGATGVWIGPNLAVIDQIRITDNGVATRGVDKTLALANSWVAPGNGQRTLYCWKDIDGAVHIAGGLKNGATAGGTVVATLPVGFRPAEIEYFIVPCIDSGGFTVPAVMSVQTNGEVKLEYAPTAGGANAQTLWPKVTFRSIYPNTIKVPTPYVV